MYLNEDIRDVVAKMRANYGNPIGVLAKYTKKSRPTISKFFNNQYIKPSTKELIYEACITLIAAKEEEIAQKKNDRNFISPSDDLPEKHRKTSKISLINLLSQPDMKQLIVALAKELAQSNQRLKGKKKDSGSLFFHFKNKQIGTD